MPNYEARIKRLEKKTVAQDKALKKARADTRKVAANLAKAKKDLVKTKKALNDSKKDIADIIKWIKLEVKWSKEVTKMLRMVDWSSLVNAFPGGGGANPPETPPDWPVT